MKKNSENSQNSFQLGYKIDSTPIVLLNALGLLGLKVVTVGGTSKVSKWKLGALVKYRQQFVGVFVDIGKEI